MEILLTEYICFFIYPIEDWRFALSCFNFVQSFLENPKIIC